MAADLTIPRDGSAITVEWVRSVLADGGHPLPQHVKSVRVEEIGVGAGVLGQVMRCHLQWDNDQRACREGQPVPRERDSGRPPTLIVKLPSVSAKNRRVSKRLALYWREYDFYRRLRSRVPLRTPGLYHAQFEPVSHRFVLVLEDLGGMGVVDQVAGATPAQARQATRALARMHGAFWNRTHESPLAAAYDSTNPKLRPIVQTVYLASLVRTLEHFGDFFSNTTRQLAEAFGIDLTYHAATLAACPQTFTHGDYRLDNLFFAQDGSDDLAAIDWQNSGVNCGLYDLAYFLIGNLTVPVRRQIERETVEEYHDVVRGAGVRDFSRDECWRLYRLNSLGPLLTNIIACGGLDRAGDRSRQLVEIGLTRSLAAIEDLKVADFFPRGRGPAYHASRLAYRAYRGLRGVRLFSATAR
ncbi:MAG: phosphotransferase [Gammaproteobacteria bacterium]|nr:phosphotransferase [Gammaproteobacteria bacterium]